MSFTSEETHIDEDCRTLTGHFKHHVFYNCLFDKLNELVLEDCDLNESRAETSKVKDALGFTLTLNCFSFKNVELSPLLFDLMLCMLLLSKGNNAKRKQLIGIIGLERARELLNEIKDLER